MVSRFVSLLALVAALLVGFTSIALAEMDEPDKPVAGQAMGTGQPLPPPQPAAPVEDPCKDCKKDNHDLRQQLDGALKALSDKKDGSTTTADNGPWHWGMGGKFGLLPNRDTKVNLLQLHGMGRWQPGIFGAEASLGLGVWPTRDGGAGSAPFAASFQLAGVLELIQDGGIFLALDYSKVRRPFKDERAGWSSNIAILGGLDLVINNIQVKLGVGPSVYATLERLHGWWISLEVGYYH